MLDQWRQWNVVCRGGQRRLSGNAREMRYFSSPWLLPPRASWVGAVKSFQTKLLDTINDFSLRKLIGKSTEGAVYWHSIITKGHLATMCLNSTSFQEQQKSEEPVQQYLIPQTGVLEKWECLLKRKWEAAKKLSLQMTWILFQTTVLEA